MAGKVPKTVSALEPISEVKKVIEPIGQKNVAGTQVNPATEDTLARQLDITLSALGEAIETYLTRATEVSVATGDATGGSTTTLQDTNVVWVVSKWAEAIVEITDMSTGKHYFVTVISNDTNTLTFPAIAVTIEAGDHYQIRMVLSPTNLNKWGGTSLTGRDISAEGLGFSGAVYENEDLATTDDPRRFETTSKKLRDLIIQVSGNDQLFGNEANQRYKVAIGETIGFTQVDLSLLYFKNAATGQNGTVNILGVED
ncbi:hypothetical protein ES708_33497 [subsurface metagenome]